MHFSQILATALVAGFAQAKYGTTTTKTTTTTTSQKTTTTSTSYPCKTYTDTYDTLPSQQPVGLYNGLQYNAWEVVAGEVDMTGVIPPSQPNVAEFSIVQDLYTFLDVTAVPFATITLGNATKSFGIYSLYFGCFDQTNGGAVEHVVTACTFEAFGFDIWGNPLPSVPFSYGPINSVLTPDLAQMNYAVFPIQYWGNVKNLTFAGSGSGSVAITDLVPFVDSLVHTDNCVYIP